MQDVIKTDELNYKSKRRKVYNFITSLHKIVTREPTPELSKEPAKQKKSKLKLQQRFMNEVIADEKDVNDEIFWNYFKYQNPLLLAKDLIRAKSVKNEQLLKNINDELIDLRNAIIKNEIPENENSNKMVDIVVKILDFSKQQKGKGIKILTPKQMFERFSIALAQVKAGNTSENFVKSYIFCIKKSKFNTIQ